jgi:hypothetical protein
MGFAMLYALMNLGGYLPTFAFLLRDDDFLGLGIVGTYWVYTALTVVALIATVVILTPRTVREAIERAKTETAAMKVNEGNGGDQGGDTEAPATPDFPPVDRVPWHWWLVWLGGVAAAWYFSSGTTRWTILAILVAALALVVSVAPVRRWVAAHPFSNAKFFYFIFALIPVQTLFVYGWLLLPQYINRSYEGWIGEYFEIASNLNPILIFIMVPIVTALSQKAKVYNMMIAGTFVMAAPAFLLSIGTTWYFLLSYILIMAVGEAMWQPRFLQYAAEIAPEGRTGVYMGVAQFPWFLTKVLVPLYSGYMLTHYVPAEGAKNPEKMWLIFATFAMSSTVLLVLAKGWLGKDFKTKSDE